MNTKTEIDTETGPNTNKTFSGFIAIVGRPNVGKSTLLNTFLGSHLSITSPKPQTTRQQIQGIITKDNTQLIFVDTPGLHLESKKKLNQYMNAAASKALIDVDVVLFLVEVLKFTNEDEAVLKKLEGIKAPVFLIINKIDGVKDKEKILPYILSLQAKFNFDQIIPISAEKGQQCDVLKTQIIKHLPEGPFYYPEESKTNRSPGFHVSEMIREQVMLQLGDELPYATTVSVDVWNDEGKIVKIGATIWVERESQKAIMIGENGDRIKRIGTIARRSIESFVGKQVFLELWVKVKENWSDDSKSLEHLGYFNFD
jgi:GTP-binding protein Era